MSRVSNTLKQALLLWSMLLVLALWLGFNQASTAMKFGVTVALIVIAVGLSDKLLFIRNVQVQPSRDLPQRVFCE